MLSYRRTDRDLATPDKSQPYPRPSAGYLGYTDFHTAALWYSLFGRPEAQPSGGSSDKDEEGETETETSEPGDDETETDADNDESEEEGSGDDPDPASDAEPDDRPGPGEKFEGDGSDSDEPDLEEGKGGADGGESDEEGIEAEAEAETPQFALTDPTEEPSTLKGAWAEIKPDGTEVYHRDFTSWFDFVIAARDGHRHWGTASRSGTYGKKWSGTDTFDEAIEMALRSGWPEGRDLMTELLAVVAPRPHSYPTLAFEVAGAFPCIPIYCAGDPACMVLDPGSDLRNQKPIVRIDYSHNVLSGVEAKSIMLRGAAVLSFAHDLEAQGYSVELRIVGASQASDYVSTRSFKSKTQIFRHSIIYKEAGQPIDLDRAAFALAHPAVFRRLTFSLYEQQPEIQAAFSFGYGSTVHDPDDTTIALGAIFIPGARRGETPETARQAVLDAAQAAGFNNDPTTSNLGEAA